MASLDNAFDGLLSTGKPYRRHGITIPCQWHSRSTKFSPTSLFSCRRVGKQKRTKGWGGLRIECRRYENNNIITRENIPTIPTMAQAATEIADQHRFPVGQLVSKYPPNIRTDDGCYHFINKSNGYTYCYKYM
jgi:hypothetical protein